MELNCPSVTELRKYLGQISSSSPSSRNRWQIPLFFTNFGQRWDRHEVHRMFIKCKEVGKIMRRGGVHTFSRHSPVTVMVSKGCDIRIVNEI
jgi:site-specific recombinase XerD